MPGKEDGGWKSNSATNTKQNAVIPAAADIF